MTVEKLLYEARDWVHEAREWLLTAGPEVWLAMGGIALAALWLWSKRPAHSSR